MLTINPNTTINTTKLARSFHMTTREVQMKLEEAGIKPTAIIEMESGKTFKAWPRDKAIKAIEATKAPVRQTARTDRLDKLEKDMGELKTLMSQILDQLTRP